MSQRIEVELDDQGRLIVPHLLQRRLGMVSGATVIVEDETPEAAFVRIQPPESQFVDKGGILVVQAQPERSVADSVQTEREHRLDSIWRSV